ncbi:MAG: hypothetical protein PGN25_01610 [Methylorubrum populi]
MSRLPLSVLRTLAAPAVIALMLSASCAAAQGGSGGEDERSEGAGPARRP